MSNVTAPVALPNPNTPLAFLDPEVAYQTSVSVYVLAGALGVSSFCHGFEFLRYGTLFNCNFNPGFMLGYLGVHSKRLQATLQESYQPHYSCLFLVAVCHLHPHHLSNV